MLQTGAFAVPMTHETCHRAKICEQRKTRTLKFVQDRENQLFQLIDTHFSRSSMFSNTTFEELYNRLVRELEVFFSAPKSILHRYLFNNWYSSSTWKCWGRKHISKISLSRITSMVEGHWLVFKRLYLLPYNRPQIDFLLYVIDSKLIQKFNCDFELLQLGQK